MQYDQYCCRQNFAGILNLAFAQIRPDKSKAKTLKLATDAIVKSASAGADLVIFPEMWSNGYAIHDRSPQLWLAEAWDLNGPELTLIREQALRFQVAIAFGFLCRHAGGISDSCMLFDRHGRQALLYHKVHTCDFSSERVLKRGSEFEVCVLDTAAGSVRVGIMICYDREFPESARLLMLKGAELIVVPNACELEQNRLCQLRARAFENMLALAICNYPAGSDGCNGSSCLFDGRAYAEGDGGSRDMCSLLAPPEPGIYFSDLDLKKLRRYRESEVHGNAYRRPCLYHALCAENIAPPFQRSDRRSED